MTSFMRTGADCIVPAVTIVLYGATGYTGRLTAGELVRRGLDHVLSGRNEEALARLAAEHGGRAQAASLDDEPALRRLLADADVVINCAGPFTLAGDSLVRAAVETRTHYVDSTGEQSFIRMVFERHGAAAERAGVALVPALGFDYAPGDCLAHLTARGHEPLDELVVAYAIRGFGMTPGNAALGAGDDEGRRRDLRGRRLAAGPARRLPGELRVPGAHRHPGRDALSRGRADHGPAAHPHA
jgi:short subunit dehydrogenase-like uncharacterized protein